MHAAFQSAHIQADLPEHSSHRLRVNRFSVVRSATDGDLFFGEAEMVSRTRCDERNGLMRFGRRAQKGDGMRHAELGDYLAVRINGYDMPTMARLSNRAAPDFDQWLCVGNVSI